MTIIDPTPRPDPTATHSDRLHGPRAVVAVLASTLRANGPRYRARNTAHADRAPATARPAPLFYGGAL